ncbi:hypothetical protein WDL1CHR_03384 [Variovorax sp. WDL1]|uniref:methanesulfonate monooxygenase n=2 Tax=Variovorax TaxID=34072 RepID=UPI00076D5807|nr:MULTISPECIES: methanesulfonate monooxygenase [unclassified Variovorax]KWT95797.1 methanesulfonate monooxygenase, hydroxylase beta subunit [Variovorax sp. WDL1]PNG58830.1 Methanesulfonate monooxygenase hydroxylase subunit beta [Variovorax sp. B4]PNG61380.1 Methanesulfonate monooxygenase hydroxylase subunit beta [Variovorax sp. B2]VTV12617.1 hypothetical protein WDL1CHR_03384 [Variovorax sp. WDL1]
MDETTMLLKQMAARDLVCDACLRLNSGDWTGFLALCDPSAFSYSIINYSPEIKRLQCWMKQDYAGLGKVLDLLPRHNSDRAHLTRHVMPCRVTPTDAGFEVISHMTVFRTEWDAEDSHLQSGATSLYVVGTYVDQVLSASGRMLLASRVVDLDTRQVGIGSHHIL